MAAIIQILRDISATWVSMLLVFAMAYGVLCVEQIQELLISAVEDRGSVLIWLIVAVTAAALCAWYFPRALLYVDYGGLQPAGEDAGRELTGVEEILPRALGALIILPISGYYLLRGSYGYGLLFLALALALVVFTVYRSRVFPELVSRRKRNDLPPNTRRIVLGILALTFVLSMAFAISHVILPQSFGAAAIIYIAVASWIAFGSYFIVHAARVARFSLIPLFIVLVFAFGYIPDGQEVRSCQQEGANHGNAARCEEPVTVREKLMFDEHLSAWIRHRDSNITSFSPESRPYPIFIVVAEGGGIRAAYWTAAVLANLQDTYPQFYCHVFALSGVSGGSFGGGLFAAQIADRVALKPSSICSGSVSPKLEPLVEQAQTVLSSDTLGPLAAGLLFSDLLKRVLPVVRTADRATFVEESWELAWASASASDRFAHSFQSLWAGQHQFAIPSMYLNATIVESGARAVSSNVRVGRPGSLDQIVDLDDKSAAPVPLSAAVHMSARFPYISPPGRLVDGRDTAHVVDGGYYDNSGAITASEIVDAVNAYLESRYGADNAPLEVVVISIDSAQKGSGRSLSRFKRNVLAREIITPPLTLSTARIHRELRDKSSLEERSGVDCYVSISTAITAKDRPLPFAWSLSESTSKIIDDRARDHGDYTKIGSILDNGCPRDDSGSGNGSNP